MLVEERDNLIPWRHEIRFRDVIYCRWALRTVAGHQIVRAVSSSQISHGANRDNRRIISWSADSAVTLVAGRVIATFIARGHYNNDPGLPSSFHSLAERVLLVALVYGPTQRDVNYSNVENVLEQNCSIDCRDYGTVGTCSTRIKNLEVDQVDSRGDPDKRLCT